MSVVVKFNLDEFNAALKRYAKAKQQPLNAEMCNQKAFWVAYNSMLLTHAADREQIERAMGHIATKAYYIPKSGKNKGKAMPYRRKQKIFAEQDTLAHRIVLKRWIEVNGPNIPMPIEKQKSAVDELRASRLRGINFVKAGFAQIAAKFAKVKWDGKRAKVSGVRQIGRKGIIKAAKSGDRALAAMTHQGLYPMTKNSQKPGRPQKYAISGLQAGFAKEIASMREYMTKKMQEAINRFPWR